MGVAAKRAAEGEAAEGEAAEGEAVVAALPHNWRDEGVSATLYFAFSLVFRQGPHFRMVFFSLRFSPLLLVVDLDENETGFSF